MVDPDENNRAVMQARLEIFGIEMVGVADFHEAQRILTQAQAEHGERFYAGFSEFDLVHGGGGRALAVWARSIGVTCPFIIMTARLGRNDPKTPFLSFTGAVDDVFPLPLPHADLEQLIRHQLSDYACRRAVMLPGT